MKIKKIVIGLTLTSILFLGACDIKKNDDKKIINKTSETNNSNKLDKKEVDELGDYKGLKIGDTVSVKYAGIYKGKYSFDFTLNSLKYTNQSLGGEEPEYESGFIIADVTILNTGKENLEMDTFSDITYGPTIFGYGKDYGFDSLDSEKEIKTGEKVTGKLVVGHSKTSNKIKQGLEGTTTTFSYDIKADEIGNYVPE